MSKEKKKCLIIDGSALAYRSYYAFGKRPLLNSQGQNISALYGFANSLLMLLRNEEPDYYVVAFDTPCKTFRHELYEDYKATREKMPEDLVSQIGPIKDLIRTMGVKLLEFPGYEADDVMAALAQQAQGEGIETFLVTADKDFFQLLNDDISIYDLRSLSKGKELIGPKQVEEKWHIPPQQVVDYLTLIGDKSDNIPGVERVGPKKAAALLQEYGSIEGIYERIDSVTPASLKQTFLNKKEDVFFFKELIQLKTDIPGLGDVGQCVYQGYDAAQLAHFFNQWEMYTLAKRVDQSSLPDTFSYKMIDTPGKADALLADIGQMGMMAVYPHVVVRKEGRSKIHDLMGLALAWSDTDAAYVPLGGGMAQEQGDLFQSVGNRPACSSSLAPFSAICAQPALKIGYDIKTLKHLLCRNAGISLVPPYSDMQVAAYFLSHSRRASSLEECIQQYLSTSVSMSQEGEPDEKAQRVAAFTACMLYQLHGKLKELLSDNGVCDVFEGVEMRLLEVLYQMEKEGVVLDTKLLARLAGDADERIAALTKEIEDLVGESFNINSPAQLGTVLFEKMKIQDQVSGVRLKKGKTGYRTDVDTLSQFQGHPVVDLVLEYRMYAKLKNTYLEKLPKQIDKATGRVHTSFSQMGTTTGRLSSSDPNLQNIPIRSDLGAQIRDAFVPAEKQSCILSADYSQIELRIVAHFSQEQVLIDAFKNNVDVHAATAAHVFGVPEEEVTADMRRRAKVINFGILYGMKEYMLSRELGSSVQDAAQYIEQYFAAYPAVAAFIDTTIAHAEEKGYVSTLLGYRRYFPELQSPNAYVRDQAIKVAVNTVIQGSAADVIRLAMVNIVQRLEENSLQSKLILQIHDELVFDVPKKEVEVLQDLVVQEMEGAYPLGVPLQVSVGVGKSWLAAHQ